MVNNHQEEASMALSTLAYFRRSILSSHFKNKRKIKHKRRKPLGRSWKVPLGYKKERTSAPNIKIIQSIEGFKNHVLHAIGPNPPNPHTLIPIQASFPHVIISDIHKPFDPTIPRCLDSQEIDSVLHEVHDGISRGYFSGLHLAIDLEWLLWIHQILVANRFNHRLNFSI